MASSPEPSERRPKFCGVLELDVTNYYILRGPDREQEFVRGPERRLIMDSDWSVSHIETRDDAA